MAKASGSFTLAIKRAEHMMTENPLVKVLVNAMMTSRSAHHRATDMLNQTLLDLQLDDPTGVSDALQGLAGQQVDANIMTITQLRENLVTVILPLLDVLEQREQALSAAPPAGKIDKEEENGIIRP